MLTIHIPKYEDLWFRREMLADGATMAYNHAWGGTIPFPEEMWPEWYDEWILHTGRQRYYRYVRDAGSRFVGEIAYHRDAGRGIYIANVLIHAQYRGWGYGGDALALLCRAARENGLSALWDDIAIDNPAISLFLSHGFIEAYRTEDAVFLRKDL